MTIARRKKKSRGGLRLRTKILLVAILALFITLVVGVRFVNRDTVLLFADAHYTLNLMKTINLAQKANTMPAAVRLAIAVERFHKENGKLPESTEYLIPDYIRSVPISPATQSPLIYKLHDDQYEITDQDITHYGYRGYIQSVAPFIYIERNDFAAREE